jgi:hypothetical protein
MSGFYEKKPEENAVYFGIYKNYPSVFVTNPYIRKKYNLLDNQGIIKSMKISDIITEDFINLTNQHWLFTWPQQSPIVTIPSINQDAKSFTVTIRVPENPDGKIDFYLLDRHFVINEKDFTTEELEPTWVRGLNGQRQQFKTLFYVKEMFLH